jgi:hypothetical protein
LATIREVKVELPNWEIHFSPKAIMYTARKSAQSYVDWYQNYENRLASSNVMAFPAQKSGKNSFSTF